jgi:hypothetical protein
MLTVTSRTIFKVSVPKKVGCVKNSANYWVLTQDYSVKHYFFAIVIILQ